MNPDNNTAISETVQPEVEKTVDKAQETPQEINWKLFREQREIERKAKEAAEKLAAEERAKAEALKAAMESLLNKNTPGVKEEKDETEEERISRRVEAIIHQREQAMKAERERQEKEELPIRLRKNMPDFDRVINSNNLDYLEFHFPEVAAPYRYMPDNQEKWEGLYKAVKRFVPNTNAVADSKKAEANLSKPQALSNTLTPQGINSGPAVYLSEERRQANWERMQRTINGVS